MSSDLAKASRSPPPLLAGLLKYGREQGKVGWIAEEKRLAVSGWRLVKRLLRYPLRV
jgi:hypothetical protein